MPKYQIRQGNILINHVSENQDEAARQVAPVLVENEYFSITRIFGEDKISTKSKWYVKRPGKKVSWVTKK